MAYKQLSEKQWKLYFRIFWTLFAISMGIFFIHVATQ